MKRQTNIGRIRYFGAKKLINMFRGFKPSRIQGRFSGPRVLMNSIPKAGTNLLERALNQFPYLRNASQRTLRGWDEVTDESIDRIRKIGRGQFYSAHLPAHDSVLTAIDAEGLRVLMMIRDPRDILVSYINYVSFIDTTHPAHEFFYSLPDNDRRLEAAIRGVDGIVSPIEQVLGKFEGWLQNRHSLIVRFEELVGEHGGGSSLAQQQTIKNISHHLRITLNDKEITSICSRLFSHSTLTFRKGQIGGWRSIFKDTHRKQFKALAGRYLVSYGYESNDNW